MQALKALVIFMGVLIVVMMGVVAYGVVVKFGDVMDGEDAAGPMVPVGAPAMAGVWDRNLHVASQRYLVFDLDTGTRIGAIDLELEAQ
jgi:hypothetical protein